jgi:hypothetical protein
MMLAHLFGTDFGIWPVRDFARYFLVLTFIVLVSWVLLYLVKKLGSILKSIASRLTALSAVYLAVDILAVFIVLIRNIF